MLIAAAWSSYAAWKWGTGWSRSFQYMRMTIPKKALIRGHYAAVSVAAGVSTRNASATSAASSARGA
jgi:hypothetical protein